MVPVLTKWLTFSNHLVYICIGWPCVWKC